MSSSYDPWRDAHDAPIPLSCRVEQIAVAKEYGTRASRLHQQGDVVSRVAARLLAPFDGEAKAASIRPHLVRVLTTPDGDSGGAR
jgi:hypothetical protein